MPTLEIISIDEAIEILQSLRLGEYIEPTKKYAALMLSEEALREMKEFREKLEDDGK